MSITDKIKEKASNVGRQAYDSVRRTVAPTDFERMARIKSETARRGCGDSGATPARRTDNGTPSDEICEQIRSLFREILKEPEFSGRFRRKKEM